MFRRRRRVWVPLQQSLPNPGIPGGYGVALDFTQMAALINSQADPSVRSSTDTSGV
jgi:hypothetical protein